MATCRLNRHGVKRDVDHARAEELDRLKDPRPAVDVGADLDQHELALHRLRRLQLDDLDDVDQLVELLGHLLKRMLLAVHHDGHPGDLLVLGRPDREGLDVEAAPGEQAGDADEDTRLVLDQDREGVLLAHEATSLALGVRVRGHAVLSDSLASSLILTPPTQAPCPGRT